MKLLPSFLRCVAWLGGLLGSVALLSTASAANPVARSLFVEGINDAATWMVRVDVDHKDRVYRTGDLLTATVRSERAGYLYLFNVDVDGEVTCLFPNKSQSNNKIEANTDIVVPDPNKPDFRIRVDEPTGRELLKAIVTTQPLKDSTLKDLKLDDLKKATGPKYQAVSGKSVKKLSVELITGDPDAQVAEDGVQAYKDKVRQDKPQQYLQQAGGWAEHQVEITTIGKGSVPPTQGTTGKPRQQERVGVFIGIGQFQDKQAIHSLQCSDKDALEMEIALHKTAGLTRTFPLINKEATFRRIQQTICKDVADATRPGDLVLIYWSGHGGRCPSGDPNKSGELQDFLVPYDGRLGNGTDLDSIRSSMVLDDTFARWIQALDGRKVVVILDACHSGGQIEGAAKSTKVDTVAKAIREHGKAVLVKNDTLNIKKANFLDGQDKRMKAIGQKDAIVLTSSTGAQVSFERPDGKMSVMTYYLIEALEAVPSCDLEQLFKYIQSKVPEYVAQQFPGTTQTPQLAPPSLTPPLTLKP
jgi:hypothetical protein